MLIIIGDGIFFVAEVEKEPKSGDILNLGDDQLLTKGRYRVNREGTLAWGKAKIEYPYYRRGELVGEIPVGENPIAMAPLNV
jgi:hypothetical protein